MAQLIKDGVVIDEREFRWQYPNTAFPAVINYADYGWSVVFPTPIPSYDPITHTHRATAPAVINGHYEQQWEVVALPDDVVAANREAARISNEKLIASKVDALWRAADKYVSGYISGIAIGLLTIGVIQSKPKALAVTAWSSSVWDEYYRRKALVTSASVDDLDFSSFGSMPHTVPELRAELGM